MLGRYTESVRNCRSSEGIFQREFSGEKYRHFRSPERKKSTMLVCRPRLPESKRIGKFFFHGKCEVAGRLSIIAQRSNRTRALVRARERAAEHVFCVRICFERSVRFDMLRCEICEYECVERDTAMAVLSRALRRHLEDCHGALRFSCSREETLDEKAAGHGHAHEIRLRITRDFDAY